MDRALGAGPGSGCPRAAEALEAELRRARLDGGRACRWRAWRPAAKLLGRTRRFPRREDRSATGRAVRGWRSGRDQVEAAPAIADAAKKDVYFHGLATIERDRAVGGGEVRRRRQRANWSADPAAGRRVLLAGREVGLVPHSRGSASTGCRRRSTRCWRWPAAVTVAQLRDGRGPQPPAVEGAAAGGRAAGVLPRVAGRADRGQADHRRSAARLAATRSPAWSGNWSACCSKHGPVDGTRRHGGHLRPRAA